MKSQSHRTLSHVFVALLLAIALIPIAFAEGKKPKYSVKEVMKETHKGQDNIGKRAAGGVASREEIAKLAEYYEALPLNEPPKGEMSSWREKTAAMVKAARALKAGDSGAAQAYKNAANCKACHTAHRPPEEKNASGSPARTRASS
jgi:hypothetical protein